MRLSSRKSFFFSLPAMLLYVVFVIFPILYGLYISLNDAGGFSMAMRFIGAHNYLKLFTDSRFLNSLSLTVFYVAISSIIINCGALLIALCLDVSPFKRFNGVARVVIYLPSILTPIIVGFIWYYILKLGVPAIFQLLGLASLARFELLSMSFSIYSVIIMTCWMQIGVPMLIFVSALLGIDPHLLDAASIDGASGMRTVLYVKIPLIMHAFIINLINTLIFCFKQFDQIYSMTKGGPGSSTETLSIFIYKVAFQKSQLGYASAAAYVLFFIVMVISLVIIRMLSRRVVEK